MSAPPLTINYAHPAEYEAILPLFDEAVAWLVARGYAEQWGDVPFSQRPGMVMQFHRYLEYGMPVARDERGGIIGTLFASPYPGAYIRSTLDRFPRRALFVEAFVVARRYAGQGVGAALLRWAEEEARRHGLEWLRLDCYSKNAELRAYYERAGFQRVCLFSVGKWPGILWERPVPPAGEKG